MHVLHAIFFNNLTNYLYFIIKIVFNFKCIYEFAWLQASTINKRISYWSYIILCTKISSHKFFNSLTYPIILVR